MSLRKMHLRSHVRGLVDRVISESSREAGATRYAAQSEVDGGASSSRVVPPQKGVQQLQSYSRGQAEHLGIPFMPCNPFRDEMVRR